MDSIKTHVEIRSDHFPLTEKELEKWDGQIGGELLAQYLSTKLTEYELPIAGFDDEDWGYHISFNQDQYQDIFIGCNCYEENDNLFLIFIHPSKTIIRKGFFKKIDISKQLNHISKILEEILSDTAIFNDVRWWNSEEMKSVK
ncbi:hypothetical protein [Acinetobacter ursingii]|uniref:hypothetical protein n=1 Tax=Acinetobacter ursingii TaxID=108980 RepID=UPI0021CE599C|nr:hypothetical protein [Acinetobacter ursingii]MCU4356732.1 hypothetical protein [Acinetobacter ursingii]